jgi:hypothetical protein
LDIFINPASPPPGICTATTCLKEHACCDLPGQTHVCCPVGETCGRAGEGCLPPK